MNEKVISGIAIAVISVLIPYIITIMMSGKAYDGSDKMKKIDSGKDIIIKIDGENRIIDVEQYIAGVLAGEADMNAGDDVLQAQAVILRTERSYLMADKDILDSALLNHTYYTYEDCQKMWGRDECEEYLSRIENAVMATLGKTENSN